MQKAKSFGSSCALLTFRFFVLFSVFLLVSCIQQEALNTECDIVWAELNGKVVLQPPRIENNKITFVVADLDTITALSLKDVQLTPGATISPNPSILQDFSQPVIYTVRSQDGLWHKEYTIFLIAATIPTAFTFETYETVYSIVFGKERPNYNVFFENYNSQKLDIWASGNPGYKLSNALAAPSQYPTSAALGDGYNSDTGTSGIGTAAKLVTRSTGNFGALVGMPIATGSLYLGTFDVKSATTNALGATKFGIPFNHKPISIEGWYHYMAGTEFIGGVTSDEPDIYAVLYKPTEVAPFLNGATILNSPQIVAVAHVVRPTSGWPAQYANFTAVFDYDTYTEKFLPELARNFGYNITIVFSSSKEGAYFKGALDSTLYIDEVKLNAEVP